MRLKATLTKTTLKILFLPEIGILNYRHGTIVLSLVNIGSHLNFLPNHWRGGRIDNSKEMVCILNYHIMNCYAALIISYISYAHPIFQGVILFIVLHIQGFQIRKPVDYMLRPPRLWVFLLCEFVPIVIHNRVSLLSSFALYPVALSSLSRGKRGSDWEWLGILAPPSLNFVTLHRLCTWPWWVTVATEWGW